MNWILVLILFLSFGKSALATYRVGVDYHATTANFSESAFISQYNVPSVRATVLSQLQSMANSGVEVISTRLWMSDPPTGRFPDNHERLGFPISAQEVANLKQYVQDVSSIKTPYGKYVDLYIMPFGGACASLTGQYCNYTWEQTISFYRQSYKDIFDAVGNLTRSDGKKAVTSMYIAGEIMIGAHANEDKFLIDAYPYFVSLAQQYGITPSLYFIITPPENEILDNNYTDLEYPILKNHKSLYWMHPAIEFMKTNNLPLPARFDISFYPQLTSASYDVLVKRVFDDLVAVYPNMQFGVAETLYPTTLAKRQALGTAYKNESLRRNVLREVIFWTTPNSGEGGENSGFPFDVASYLPEPVPTRGVTTADINKDGKTNMLDFSLWKSEYLGLVTTKLTDFNKDGVVNLIDLSLWRAEYLKN